MAVRPRGNTGSLQVREADLGVYRKRSEHLSQTRSMLHGESQLLLCKPIVEVFGKWSQVVASGRKWTNGKHKPWICRRRFVAPSKRLLNSQVFQFEVLKI